MPSIIKKTKILYVITKSNWGGAQRYVFDLASNAPKDQFEIAVAAGDNGILFDKLKNAKIKTIKIMGLERDIKFFKDIKLFWELFKIFSHEKPDIIHLNSSKMGFAGAVATLFLNLSPFTLHLKPGVIFTVHGWPFNEDRPMLERFTFKLLAWTTLLLANKIICVSEKIRTEAPSFIIKKSKFQVIKNGVALQNIYSKEQAQALILKKINASPMLDKNSIWLGSIAELTKNKGLIFGLEALRLLNQNNLHWFIIGDGDLKEKLKTKVSELHIEKQVHFLGYLENASAYLKAFDAYLLPSITESLGYTLLEAGLAKIPVIASNIGGVPEIIEHKKTGLLVKPKDPQVIADAIAYLLKSQKEAKQFGENLYKKVVTEFSLTEMLKKTFELYLLA